MRTLLAIFLLCPWLAWGQALSFNGISSGVVIPSCTLVGDAPHTMIIFLKSKQTTICAPFVIGKASDGTASWCQFILNYTTYGQIGAGNSEGSVRSDASVVVPTNQIFCLSYSYNPALGMPTGTKLYTNGLPISGTYVDGGGGSEVILITDTRHSLGYRWGDNLRWSNVEIYQFRLYNRVLTDAEQKIIGTTYPIGSDNVSSGLVEKFVAPLSQTGEAVANGLAFKNIVGDGLVAYPTNCTATGSIIGNRRLK